MAFAPSGTLPPTWRWRVRAPPAAAPTSRTPRGHRQRDAHRACPCTRRSQAQPRLTHAYPPSQPLTPRTRRERLNGGAAPQSQALPTSPTSPSPSSPLPSPPPPSSPPSAASFARPSTADIPLLPEGLDATLLPTHVAVIMDGNGRWGRLHHLPRTEGHRRGASALRQLVNTCVQWHIPRLTVFAFSAENWGRPQPEVDALLGLVSTVLRAELDALRASRVRVRFMGERGALPHALRRQLRDAEAATSASAPPALTLTVALSYGGRQQIAGAARRIAQDVERGALNADAVDDALFARYLDSGGGVGVEGGHGDDGGDDRHGPEECAGVGASSDALRSVEREPEPDLLIRTGGEMRLSNFMLWQVAYSELYVTDTLWPDFSRADLHQALQHYATRQRRYGR